MITACTTRFNIQQFHILPTQSVFYGSENKQPYGVDRNLDLRSSGTLCNVEW